MNRTQRIICAGAIASLALAGMRPSMGAPAWLTAVAQASTGNPTPLVLGQTVQIERGKDFSVSLSGTSGTNFEWSYAKTGSGLVSLREAQTSVGKKKSTGTPYQKTWTFSARKSGTVKLTFSLARSWPSKLVERTAVFNVQIVEPSKSGTASSAVEAREGSTTRVKVGNQFCIRQKENGSTGYQWTYKGSGSGSASFVQRSSAPVSSAPGSPSEARWTFQAQTPGTYKLVFTYARPWEKTASDKAITYTIEIVK